MGMTIEEAIEELESTKDYPASDPASDEALDFAIDIMRKYQKIQEIINNTDYIQEDVIRYKMICKEVKDGENND